MTTTSAEEEEAAFRWIDDVTVRARIALASHPHFRGRADNFEFVECDCALVVRGQVPTYYLKQVLQCVLRDVAGITRIDNRVDVVCPDGLSSVWRRPVA